jgi:hypothetical protein
VLVLVALAATYLAVYEASWNWSRMSNPPVSSYLDSGGASGVMFGIPAALLLAAAVWLTARTVTGTAPSRTTTIVVLVGSLVLMQIAMAVAADLGRRQGLVEDRAEAAACSEADVATLQAVLDSLSPMPEGEPAVQVSVWGRADGSCVTNLGYDDPAYEGDQMVDVLTEQGWTLVDSSPDLLVLHRGEDELHAVFHRSEWGTDIDISLQP